MKRLLIDRAAAGMAVILSTHQLGIVEDVAHRVAILSQGRLVSLGRLSDLKAAHGSARLEDVFFRLTGDATPP